MHIICMPEADANADADENECEDEDIAAGLHALGRVVRELHVRPVDLLRLGRRAHLNK